MPSAPNRLSRSSQTGCRDIHWRAVRKLAARQSYSHGNYSDTESLKEQSESVFYVQSIRVLHAVYRWAVVPGMSAR